MMCCGTREMQAEIRTERYKPRRETRPEAGTQAEPMDSSRADGLKPSRWTQAEMIKQR